MCIPVNIILRLREGCACRTPLQPALRPETRPRRERACLGPPGPAHQHKQVVGKGKLTHVEESTGEGGGVSKDVRHFERK